jgi:hypothetical protein
MVGLGQNLSMRVFPHVSIDFTVGRVKDNGLNNIPSK